MKVARRPRRNSDRGERGASLILALVFIVVVAVIVGAISSLALNNLNNTTKFNSATALDYSASSAASLAIQGVRYAPQAVDGTVGPCWGTDTTSQYQPPTQSNGQTGPAVAIWCTSVHHPGSSQTRDVTMIACVATVTEANCQNDPVLTLVEAYDDYSAAGTDTCVGAQASATTCGFGASTLVWKWGSLAAAVGGLILNTISVSPPPPGTGTVNATYTPIVTATSGDPVTIDAAGACTVTGGVVTYASSPGTCTLNFTDPGNFNYAPATPVSYQILIS
jgi:hypothetical protein